MHTRNRCRSTGVHHVRTGLANEEVVNGKCERCGADVTKKNLRQWMLKITAYADRLLADLDKLDWPEKVKKMQAEWIGKSQVQKLTSKLMEEMMRSQFIQLVQIHYTEQHLWY